MKETGAFLDEGDEMQFDEMEGVQEAVAQRQPEKLSAENLSQMDAASKKSAPSKGSKKSKAS